MYFYILILSFSMNHVHSSALTRSLLPNISPLLACVFSTPVGLSWYHASIAHLPAIMFSTPMGLLTFIKLLVVIFLLSIDLLLARLFSTLEGFALYNDIKDMEANWYQSVLSPAKHIIQFFQNKFVSNFIMSRLLKHVKRE